MNKVTFEQARQDGFYKALIKNTEDYFTANGISKKGNWLYALKTSSYFLIALALYYSILSNRFDNTGLIILFILFGLFITIFLFTIAHDASHNAISNKPWVNKLFAYVWNLCGISSYFWALKHNIAHHSFTNIPGKDDDIDQSKLVRLNPNAPRRKFHRFQHIYAPFLYSLLSINIIYFRDFKLLLQHDFGNKTIKWHPKREIWILIATKIFFIIYMVIIPKMALNISWAEIIGYHILMHLAIGLFIGFILVPVHVTGESEYRLPDTDGKIQSDWGSHQMEATVDFAANNYFINWITGGLNTHVVHHLFPSINHIHYYQLTKIIRRTALEQNFPYRNYSMAKVISEHLHFLKELGRNNNPTLNRPFGFANSKI